MPKLETRICGVVFIMAILIYLICSANKLYSTGMEWDTPNVNWETLHISVDDVNSIFYDLTLNADSYNTIFDNRELHILKDFHDRYGVEFTLYCMYSNGLSGEDYFDLSYCTDVFSNEFRQNSDWLKFGFHAVNSVSYEDLYQDLVDGYYEKTIYELKRITDADNNISDIVRLDRYFADKKSVDFLYNNGVRVLLCADDFNRESYDLSISERRIMYEEDWYSRGKMDYTPSDIRLENILDDSDFYEAINNCKNQSFLSVFTHEYMLKDVEVIKYLKYICDLSVGVD